ncbi:MAG: phosphoribosylanthranilate isomerase [Candidatus Palauibacterales bacterium]|nr:phosphoribosylanthranilate isomerase [Candidatus Palauibacterales bacterium]MDP2529488.1 phosphoribosylanthranilate isomerase [Candidatus Palauibacterales bacterium]MDP2585164.1 phosphoribosylanthranilate isomerase [Candidatus Palauibacterales bacterium]
MDGPKGAPRVKICGLTRPEDVRAAAAAGSDYAGFVLAGGPRHVEAVRARELLEAGREAARLGGGPEPVAVLVDAAVAQAREAAAAAGARIVQLHGSETPEACAALREAGLVVWKALRPRSLERLRDLVIRYRGCVDALHVEGWSPRAAGGTGTGFPWTWIGALREEGILAAAGGPGRGQRGASPAVSPAAVPQLPRLVLAGGLTPDNVAEAIRRVRPDAVDVSSGVEVRPGVKDPARVRAFVERARNALG